MPASIMLDTNNIAKQYSGGAPDPHDVSDGVTLPADTDRRPRFTPPPSARNRRKAGAVPRPGEATNAQVKPHISANGRSSRRGNSGLESLMAYQAAAQPVAAVASTHLAGIDFLAREDPWPTIE